MTAWSSPVRRLLALSWVFLAVPAVSIASYPFVFTNPSLGRFDAPYVLEYYSVADCIACRQFEVNTLSELKPLVDTDELRIVFRDLPPPAAARDAARELFCLQAFPDYFSYRVALKRDPDSSPPDPRQLPRRDAARYQACLQSAAIDAVFSHNLSAFEALQFVATPGISVSSAGQPARRGVLLNGPVTTEEVAAAIESLRPSDTSAETGHGLLQLSL